MAYYLRISEPRAGTVSLSYHFVYTWAVRNNNNDSDVQTGTYDFIRWANFSSSDEVFSYRFFDFSREASWSLIYEIGWQTCTTDTSSAYSSDGVVTNITYNHIDFTTRAGAQDLDLATITASHDNCPAAAGLTINVTDTVEAYDDWTGRCAVVASPIPTVAPHPCQVSIDSAVAASIFASMTAEACLYPEMYPPPTFIACPEEDAAQRLIVGAVVCLAAGLGAMLHFFL